MVKRYFAGVAYRRDGEYAFMEPDNIGDYVRYEDCAALEERVAELERDAARYRWLRNQSGGSAANAAVTISLGFDWYKYNGDVLDGVIDQWIEDSK